MRDAQTAPAMGSAEWAMLVALSLLWGGSFFFFKVLAAELPAFTVVLGRVGFAALALNLWLAARGDYLPRDPRLWARFLVMGLLNNVLPFWLIVVGEMRISSGLASILNAATPIFTILVAQVLTADEKLSLAKSAGVLLGFAGVATLIGPAVFLRASSESVWGEAACLLAALSYAFAGVFGRGFKGVPPLKVATGQVTASTVVLLPIAALVDRPWTLPAPSVQVWLSFAGIALLSTALAYVIYFRILATAGATNLLLVTFLLPVSAMTLGVAFLGESVTWQALAGMALIGLGLAAIDGRLLQSVTPRAAIAPAPPAPRQ